MSPSETLERAAAGTPATSAGSVAALDHLAHLTVAGVDARTFLDGQLTRNVPPGAPAGTPFAASLAGYCSPKGRLLATFVVWSDADAVHLLAPRDGVDALVRRLRMYVLRAKAVVTDASAAWTTHGVIDPAAPPAPVDALEPWQGVVAPDATWLRQPDADGRRRYLRIVAADDAGTTPDGVVDAATWRWSDVRAGVPRIVVATQDRFVPQMVNLEALGGVDFRKGCFPGQEIVARSQYLGKLKRRTALVAADDADDALPGPGADVWIDGQDDPQGTIVDSARAADGRRAALVELPVAAFGTPEVRLGAVDGPRARLEPAPYPLPDNEVFVRPKL